MADARAIGALLHLRERHVNKLLRELEEDGLVSALVDAPDHCAFIPPYTRRLAA